MALSVAGTGCWRASEISTARATEATGRGNPRILVVPLNTAVRLAAGLEAAVEPVQRELLAQLEAQGARVSFLAVEDAALLWKDTVATLRQLDRNTASLQEVTGTFIRTLRDVTEFDLALMPSLGYREATVDRAYATWDGVTRSMTARRQTWALMERVPTYSLHVQLYTPDGRLWTERWGGIDLVHQSDLDDTPALTHDQVERSADYIRLGVSVALGREDG